MLYWFFVQDYFPTRTSCFYCDWGCLLRFLSFSMLLWYTCDLEVAWLLGSFLFSSFTSNSFINQNQNSRLIVILDNLSKVFFFLNYRQPYCLTKLSMPRNKAKIPKRVEWLYYFTICPYHIYEPSQQQCALDLALFIHALVSYFMFISVSIMDSTLYLVKYRTPRSCLLFATR